MTASTAARLGITAQSLDSGALRRLRPVGSLRHPRAPESVLRRSGGAPQYWQSPEGLKDIYLQALRPPIANIPLLAVATNHANTIPLAINHTGLFPSVTVSFNLIPTCPSAMPPRASRTCSGASGRLPRFKASSPARFWPISNRSAPSHPGSRGATRRLHRSRRFVRKPRPSAHDHFKPSTRERRRDARIDAFQGGSQHHLDHRHRAADRYRKKERDHDDRLCSSGRTGGGQVPPSRFSKLACFVSARS